MEKIIPRNYRGTRDWRAGEVMLRQNIINVATKVFQEFGFEALETPVIELREILQGKYGEEGNSLTYFFRKSGEEIGLRYDHTVPLARVVAQYGNELVMPYRRYAIGPVFRADTPQKGRYRQFTQLDYDVIGVSSPIADAEVVTISYTVLSRLGFTDFEIQIFDRNLLNGMAQFIGASTKDEILAVLRSWDKIEKASREQIAEELDKAGCSIALIQKFNKVTDSLLNLNESNEKTLAKLGEIFLGQQNAEKGIDTLTKIIAYLSGFGVPSEACRINPTLARGLDYYTGPIFETIVKKAGVGSITGGGRFDNLIETLGGPSIPGTGSSFGLERLISVMETLGIATSSNTSVQVFVTVFDPKNQRFVEKSLSVATILRKLGYNTEIYMDNGRLGKQFQLADSRGASLVIVIGPDEIEKGLLTIKDLRTGKGGSKTNQIQVPESTFTQKVGELLTIK